MIKTAMADSKGHVVCDIEIDGSGCDAYIYKASYLVHENSDGSHSVPDDELDFLTDKYADVVQEMVFENQVCQAEYAFEGDR